MTGSMDKGKAIYVSTLTSERPLTEENDQYLHVPRSKFGYFCSLCSTTNILSYKLDFQKIPFAVEQ